MITVFLHGESKPIKPSHQLALFCIYLQVKCNSCDSLEAFSHLFLLKTDVAL